MAAGGKSEKPGMRRLKAAIDGVKVVPFQPAAGAGADRDDRDQGGPTGGRSRGRGDVDQPRLPLLPAGCPITPLGKRGQDCFYLDEAGQLIKLSPRDHGKTHILNLFGAQSGLCHEYWPRVSDKIDERTNEPRITGWKPEEAAEVLMRACAMQPIFDPIGRVRGRGAHRHHDGALILHCGDRVLIGGIDAIPDPEDPGAMIEGRDPQWHHPGLLGRFVYPTGAELPRPAHKPQGSEAGDFLLGLFGCWRWEREIDRVLLLGWVCAARVGGALKWRPHGWITGDSSTGKSTLQEAVDLLFAGALLQSANATEAGVRQVLGDDTLPVAIDEGESGEDNRKMNQLIELARIASSGARGLRGGQDHKGHEFTVRSCFLFSSILVPAMLPQDRNRMAILSLKRLDGITPPVLDPRQLAAVGAALTRRLIDHWPRFDQVLEGFRQRLARYGHKGRTADQFGTLLACADLVLHGDDDEVEELHEAWAASLAIATLTEASGELSNADRCAERLAQSVLPAQGGEEPVTIASLCLRGLRDSTFFDKMKRKLGTAGMRVVSAEPRPDSDKLKIDDPLPVTLTTTQGTKDRLYLAVCSSHRGLDPLFRDTAWQGRPGAQGAWSQALRRIEGAIANQRVRVDGRTEAVTLVPLAAVAELDEEPPA